MYNIAVLISGISIVLSVFLLGVSRRVLKRRRTRILSYISWVFVVILISNAIFVLQVFSVLPMTGHETTMLLAEELIILVLFYAGIARGLS